MNIFRSKKTIGVINSMQGGYLIFSVIILLFLAGCTSIICSILFETSEPYRYRPARRKPLEDDIVINLDLFED